MSSSDHPAGDLGAAPNPAPRPPLQRAKDTAIAVALISAVVGGIITGLATAFVTAGSIRNEALRSERIEANAAYLSHLAVESQLLFDSLHWLDQGDPDDGSAEYAAHVNTFWTELKPLQVQIAADYAKVSMLIPASDLAALSALGRLEDARSGAFLHYKCRANLQQCSQEPAPRGSREVELEQFLVRGDGDLVSETNDLIVELRRVVNGS